MFVHVIVLITKQNNILIFAGKYNSGKSFLMNHLFDIKPNDGFSIGQSHNATTKGIWMHALPNQKVPIIDN